MFYKTFFCLKTFGVKYKKKKKRTSFERHHTDSEKNPSSVELKTEYERGLGEHMT